MYKQGAAQAQGYKDPKGDQGPKDQEKGRGGKGRREGVGKGKARMHKHARKDADGSLCIAGAATPHADEHGRGPHKNTRYKLSLIYLIFFKL